MSRRVLLSTLGIVLTAGLLAAAGPVTAQGLFDGLLKQAVPDLKQALQPDTRTDPALDGPNRLADGPAGGTAGDAGPVALVEAAAAAGGLQAMDYVYQDQRVELGRQGRLTLSHLDGCLVEEVAGGSLVVGRGGSRVSGGKLTAARPGDCVPATPVVMADAREAGATVNRVTPFEGRDWSEQVSKSSRPTFVWPAGGGGATVRVLDLDAVPPQVLWQATVPGHHASYPDQAPALRTGMPYRVEVTEPAAPVIAANFTIDPGLDLPDTLANRVVALDR